MDNVQSRADRHLMRLDKKVGIAASYFVFSGIVTNVETGSDIPTFTEIPYVMVRTQGLTIQDRINLSSAGLTDVETAWKVRQSYLGEPNRDDEIHLTVSGFKYIVFSANLDRVQADWTIYTRRRKF